MKRQSFFACSELMFQYNSVKRASYFGNVFITLLIQMVTF